MPQFDIVVYSNEIIWIFFFFLSLYSLNYLFFFPRISEIFKVRIKKYNFDLNLFKRLISKVDSNFYLKQNNFFYYIYLKFEDFLNFNIYINYILKLNLLGENLYVKYYLNILYNYFDFFELDKF